MRNPWRMQDGPDNKINRNNFPMSFQYNGTFKYGKIYPIGLIRTIPGASYQIDSTLALNFLPTAFPIQTRQRAYVHFFYGRDRNFWKDYKDFVNGMNPDLVKPYLDTSVTKPRTGSLLDYLGVPTTLVGDYGSVELDSFMPTVVEDVELQDVFGYVFGSDESVSTMLDSIFSKTILDASVAGHDVHAKFFGYWKPSDINLSTASSYRVNVGKNDYSGYINDFLTQHVRISNESAVYTRPTPLSENQYYKYIALALVDGSPAYNSKVKFIRNNGKLGDNGQLTFNINYTDLDIDSFEDPRIYIVCLSALGEWSNSGEVVHLSYKYWDGLYFSSLKLYGSSPAVIDIDDTTSPYWRSGATTDLRTRIKLNAIPCRMYETIYNLYFRNPQNNPYILNGKPEYNQFIPTKDGGVDSNLYELRYRNWEDDFLTTAVQTPQQGIAPLVGLTDRGATVTLTNEDGSVTRYKTNLDENGNVTGIETTDSSEPLLTQALIDAVSYGISIEDLRNVNAMQKWLELNLRKGYQYKDIIEARWGISISYNELDLPEFIGGFTQEVGLQAVTQTSSHGEGIEGALGWQAGRMYAAGSGRSITHYCEEEGYIMALLTVVPVPNYSQLLPKHWFTRDLLDSYQPEFNHIGFQPITYKEVCPIQAYQESTENVDVLEQTFGYQRPWYEYFNQVDEVHGQFRTTFKDFLINRTFDVKPELSESFLLVDPNQVNDVFAVQTDDDKILGAINHRIIAKLPISLYAQARLE